MFSMTRTGTRPNIKEKRTNCDKMFVVRNAPVVVKFKFNNRWPRGLGCVSQPETHFISVGPFGISTLPETSALPQLAGDLSIREPHKTPLMERRHLRAILLRSDLSLDDRLLPLSLISGLYSMTASVFHRCAQLFLRSLPLETDNVRCAAVAR